MGKTIDISKIYRLLLKLITPAKRGTIMSLDYKSIYNYIYKKSSVYSKDMDQESGRIQKDPIIFKTVKHFNPKTLLDIGCGQGYYVRKFRNDLNIDALGVEVSSFCCEKYLQDIPHLNTDALSFLRMGNKFDFLFSTDVLEHIEKIEVSKILELASKAASIALFGLANHSDIQLGIELHVIREDAVWWQELLSSYYDNVQLIASLYDGRFFFILCSQSDNLTILNSVLEYRLD